MRQKKFTFTYFLNKFILLVTFLLLLTTLIAATNGYLFDWRQKKFVGTGIINLTVNEVPVRVTVNGKEKKYKKSPINIPYLVPGQYTVEVHKDGYYPWTKTFYVTAGNVQINPFIELFLADTTSVPATVAQSAILPEIMPVPQDMDIRDTEIWTKKIERTYPFITYSNNLTFLTRYASPVLGAVWMPDRTNIVFQVGNEIRVIDRDGTNDHLLAQLSDEQAKIFAITNDGKYLVYKDGDQVFSRRIQE